MQQVGGFDEESQAERAEQTCVRGTARRARSDGEQGEPGPGQHREGPRPTGPSAASAATIAPTGGTPA